MALPVPPLLTVVVEVAAAELVEYGDGEVGTIFASSSGTFERFRAEELLDAFFDVSGVVATAGERG